MTIAPLDFGIQSDPGRYGHDMSGRLINCYAEQADGKGKAQFPFFPIEGLASFASVSGATGWRGGISLNSYGYVVFGPVLSKVDQGGAATVIGGFPGGEPVFMARNRKAVTPQIALVSDGLRYICENDVLTSIADTDLPASNSVISIAGYFIFTVSDGRFFITSIDEGTTIDALDFASAETSPDGLSVAYARGREAIMFGPSSIEFWAHTGAAAFPFELISPATISSLGVLCKHSVRDLNDIIFFVASDGTVRMLDGNSPTRVSTHSVERAIDGITDKDSITATAYSIRGHQFYNLSSPTWTWTYDGVTGLWHERESYNETRWRGEGFVNINGKRIIGDHESGLLYQLDPDTFTEAANHLVWKLQSAPMHAYPNRAIVNRLFLDTIPGTGLNTTDAHNSNPQVMLRYSDTGTKNWSNERQAATGAIGEYDKQVVFSRLGETKEDGRIYQVSMSAAVIRGLTGAAVDVELSQP